MRCSKCGSDNREGRKFCTTCGTPLSAACPKCGALIEPGERFCGECGAGLAETATKPAEVKPIVASADGERRHLTVLFCDLAGSTGIAARLDPEEWRETVSRYHRAATEAITRYDGHVAKYLGDGVMAFFGYPEAHDNDAERAARAGLAIVEAISKLSQQPEHLNLAVRVGIDSGAIVVGAGANKDADVFGEAPNIAARVQAVAEPGTVIITDATHRLVSGLFLVDQLGAQALKGIERPVHLYRVIQPSGVRGRLEAAAATRGLTPFVGREDELRSLMSRWARALDGEGQVALVIGEAGIGKSRLVHRFHEQISGTPHTWVECATAPFYQNTPFYPVAAMLRELLAMRADQPDADQLARLEPRLIAAGLKPAEAIPLIAPLLNLALPYHYPASSLQPDQQRRRLLATLVEWMLGVSSEQPFVIVTEDLHWADPSTLELSQMLVEQGAMSSLMLLYTARPEFKSPWLMRTHHVQVTLNRLGSRDVREMIAQVAAQKALPEQTVATVVERTGGVPLFVEELTRAVLESGDSQLTGHAIPVTLHDSLMARLDRLGPAREVLQMGAVLGSDFSYELLHAIHPITDADLQRSLHTLTDAELLYARGIAPEATYQFKHALIRDIAYEALLKSRRKDLHRIVAPTIAEQFPVINETHPEVLARHWTEAGATEPAITAWHKAGERATARSAYAEAISQATKGLELLNTLPDTSDRARKELIFQTTLAHALTATGGWADPGAGKAFAQSVELCQRLGDSAHLFRALYGSWSVYTETPHLQTAVGLGQQLLTLAEKMSDPALIEVAHCAVGFNSFFRGEIVGARDHLQLAIAVGGEARVHSDSLLLYGYETRVPYGQTTACALWLLGYPDQALERSRKTLTLADELSHPYSSAVGLFWSATFHRLRRDWRETQQRAEDLVAVCTEQGFTMSLAFGTILRGSVLAKQGAREQGIADIQRGLADHRATGGALRQTFWLALLVEAYAQAGRIDVALTVLADALRVVEQTEERWYEAELYRLEGELLLVQHQSNAAEAESWFRRAIELARHQNAKSWELRATIALAQQLAQQNRREQAHDMLVEIYNWFTEGFDTSDLKEAKALLDELSR